LRIALGQRGRHGGPFGRTMVPGALPTRRVVADRHVHPDGPIDAGVKSQMKVWIDQDLCTGDGLCEEIAPAVFTLLDDGLAYVKDGADVKSEPGGSAGMAAVPDDLEDAVVEASEECPGECIFIEQS
jgi:ferredoxin